MLTGNWQVYLRESAEVLVLYCTAKVIQNILSRNLVANRPSFVHLALAINTFVEGFLDPPHTQLTVSPRCPSSDGYRYLT